MKVNASKHKSQIRISSKQLEFSKSVFGRISLDFFQIVIVFIRSFFGQYCKSYELPFLANLGSNWMFFFPIFDAYRFFPRQFL